MVNLEAQGVWIGLESAFPCRDWEKIGRRVLGAMSLVCWLAKRKCGTSPHVNLRVLLTFQRFYPNSSDSYCFFLITLSHFTVMEGKDNDTKLTWFVCYTQPCLQSLERAGGKDSSFPTPQELANNLFVYCLFLCLCNWCWALEFCFPFPVSWNH